MRPARKIVRRARGRTGRRAGLTLALLTLLVPLNGGARQATSTATRRPGSLATAGPLPKAADFVAGRAVVRFRAGATASQRAKALAAAGARPIRNLMVKNYLLVSMSGGVAPALRRLAAQRAIAHAEPDLLLRSQIQSSNDPCNNTVRDPRCPSIAWHLAAVGALGGWSRYPGAYFSPANPKTTIPAASRVKVAVIDVFVPRNNPDFKNGYTSDDVALGGQLDVAGMNAFGSNVPAEYGSASFHGAYVAGLVAASADNSFGGAGIGYHADLLPLSAVHGNSGAAESVVVGDAIVYAHARGARVITLALGVTTPSSYINSAIQQVTGAPNPPLVVAAAGNNTGDAPFYPAWFDNVMAIGGSDQADRKAHCANFGPKVSVVAPAKDIQGLSADLVMVAPECGTSAATPQVAGLAALLFSQDPSRTPEQVRRIIELTADDLGAPGRDDRFGHGRINADRALAFGMPLAETIALSATPARASGGLSRITATVRSNAPITDAELFVDRQPSGQGDRGFPLQPTDGTFDSYVEELSGQYGSGSLAPGAHRISVRAKDATGVWGPAATAAIYVDAYAPALTSVKATDVIRPLDTASMITFGAADEFSDPIFYDIEVVSTLTGTRVWRITGVRADGGSQATRWTPAVTDLPGRYVVRVTVRDDAGNAASAAASMLLL